MRWRHATALRREPLDAVDQPGALSGPFLDLPHDDRQRRLMPGVPNLLDYLVEGAPDLATALPHLPDVTLEAEAELLDAIRANC